MIGMRLPESPNATQMRLSNANELTALQQLSQQQMNCQSSRSGEQMTFKKKKKKNRKKNRKKEKRKKKRKTKV